MVPYDVNERRRTTGRQRSQSTRPARGPNRSRPPRRARARRRSDHRRRRSGRRTNARSRHRWRTTDQPQRRRSSQTLPGQRARITESVDYAGTAGSRRGSWSKPRAASSPRAPSPVISTSIKTSVATSSTRADHRAPVANHRRVDPNHWLGGDWRCSANAWTSARRAAAIASRLDVGNRRIRYAVACRREASDVVVARAPRF